MNGSDTRSFKDLYEAIEKGQSQDIFFEGKKRPACLIIDEVDGAVTGGDERGFAGLMRKLESFQLQRKNEMSSDNKSKNKLRRPIIFIANNFYARSIKALRNACLPVQIPESDPQRLMTRLRYIANQEKLEVANDVLNQIVQSTNSDARSSINQL